MLNRVQNVLFKLNILELLIFYDDVLSDALHCKELASSCLLNQEHFAECALANQFAQFEVLQLHTRLLIPGEDILASLRHRLPNLHVHLIHFELVIAFLLVFKLHVPILNLALLLPQVLLLIVLL